jgi:Glycosyltransferase 61
MPLPRTLRILRDRALVRARLRQAVVRVRPSRAVSMADFVRRRGARWDVVHPAQTPHRVVPIQHGPRPIDFASRMEAIPDLGVLRAPGLVLVGPLGLVLTRGGELLVDTGFWHGFPQGLPEGPRTPVRRLRGSVVSIMSDYATKNYGHFLMDALPRVSLLEQAGVSLRDADHIYCGAPSARAARLLDELGVPVERRIDALPGVAIQADEVIVTSYPGARRNYPPWVPDFLRERLGVPAAEPHRRLYIPRTTHRRIVNENELVGILLEHGFEVFEPSLGEDPRHAFAEASVVVGGHGAGLADLAFCRTGAAVLELLPDSHPMPFYATMAASARLRYGYLLGDGIPPRAGRLPRARWDFRVDADLFRAALVATIQ